MSNHLPDLESHVSTPGALQPVSKLAQLGSSFAKARDSLELFKKLAAVEVEPDTGSALREYSGKIE
ncbi:MAG: hypothetical protein VYB56_07215, partial [Actinomycetota bacterium]|nr:hypothetical protein [Actinomycetota bacterium]